MRFLLLFCFRFVVFVFGLWGPPQGGPPLPGHPLGLGPSSVCSASISVYYDHMGPLGGPLPGAQLAGQYPQRCPYPRLATLCPGLELQNSHRHLNRCQRFKTWVTLQSLELSIPPSENTIQRS